MRQITSIVLILLLSLQCFFKLGVITYFELNRDYIIDVLCVNKDKPITMCYGECFLKKNLRLADDASSSKEKVPVTKQNIEFPVFIISDYECRLSNAVIMEMERGHYTANSSEEYISSPFHPPALTS